MMNMNLARFRLGWGLLGVFALIMQAIATSLAIPGYFTSLLNVVNFFSYFTILTNISVTLWLLLGFQSLQAGQKHWWGDDPQLKGSILTAATVTILVYWTLLVNIPLPNVPAEIANFLLHLVVPLGMWIDWIIVRDPVPQGYWQMLRSWLVFPILFGIYSVIRGKFVNWYPYFFLDPGVVGGLANQALAIAGMTVLFLIVGSVIYWLYQKWGGFAVPAAK